MKSKKKIIDLITASNFEGAKSALADCINIVSTSQGTVAV